MYATFEARNFRGFRHLRVSGLRTVNLIAGLNNAGKTTLLEALFLHCGAFNPRLVLTVASNVRGIQSYRVEYGGISEPPWRSLFSQLDESKPIELVGTGSPEVTRVLQLNVTDAPSSGGSPVNGKPGSEVQQTGTGSTDAVSARERQRALELKYAENGGEHVVRLYFDEGFKTDPATPPRPPFPARLLSSQWRSGAEEDSEFFGELAMENRERELIDPLRIIAPQLGKLSTIVLGGKPMLHADIGLPRLVPLAVLGDGLQRLARLILNILHTRGGVVLIDEIENGLHHSVMKQVWGAIARAARASGVQIFATTHSRECVVAAHEAFSELLDYEFSLQRLERDRKDDIIAVAYNKEALDGAILAGFEVR